MQALLEIVLIGLCLVTVIFLFCWGGWELRQWWTARKHRRDSSALWQDREE